MVPAEYSYRETLKENIANINQGGYTYYVKAMNKAFEITANSDALGLTANCSRVYVFLTDGAPSDDIAEFESTILANKGGPQVV